VTYTRDVVARPGSDDPDGRPRIDSPSDFTGDPDGFERLWTPHRMVYLQGQTREPDAAASECPFCRAPELDDAEGLIVARGEHAFVVLNLFPYNTGHLLVCPYRHTAYYPDLDEAETAEVAALTKTAMRVLTEVSGCHGFNIGMNQGTEAGAGIAAHLHQHIVPRWSGDANFLPIIGRTRALPELLGETRARLVDAWPAP
jgi:ATP adenylyltransferase